MNEFLEAIRKHPLESALLLLAVLLLIEETGEALAKWRRK